MPCRNLEDCLNSTLTRLALGHILPPTEWGQGLCPLVHDGGYSTPFNVKVKNARSCASGPHTSSWHGAYFGTSIISYGFFF